MPKRYINKTVFDAALNRMVILYKAGHRIIVSFSTGKDSGVSLEICRLAAKITHKQPVEVIMRDEEIMFPGTFEYAERIAKEPDIKFYWIIANQPIVNVYNRRIPYFWVFDSRLKREQWMRQPPEFAEYITDKCIDKMVTIEKYPPLKGKELYVVLGLRVQESPGRRMGLYSSGGYVTQPNRYGVRYCRPIYDFKDGDIWKAIYDNNWDYNSAYDIMHRLGVSKNKLRIAPPTLAESGLLHLQLAHKAWVKWFEKLCERLPNVRLASLYGKRAIQPRRNYGETWSDCYQRTCVDEAPEWIAERALKTRDRILSRHATHSNAPFPEVTSCPRCNQVIGSYRRLCNTMYNGDPFCLKQHFLPYIEPEFFRDGAVNGKGNHLFKGVYMNYEKFLGMIEDAYWKPTTYIKPHEYIIQSDYPDLFQCLANRIREKGYPQKFMGKEYRYVDIEGYSYWRCDNIINRAKIERDYA